MENTFYRHLLKDIIVHIEYYLDNNEPSYLVMEEKAILDIALQEMYDRDIPDNAELVAILKENRMARRLYEVLEEHPYNRLRI